MSENSRKKKYKYLRDSITADNESSLRTNDLKEFENRLNRISPSIVNQAANTYESIQNTINNIDNTLSLHNEFVSETNRRRQLDEYIGPFGIIDRPSPKPAVQSEPVSQPAKEPARMSSEPTMDIHFQPSSKSESPSVQATPMTVEEIKAQVQQTLQEHPVIADPVEDTMGDDTRDDILAQTREMEIRARDYGHKLNGMKKKIDSTNQTMNAVLWTIILALAVILIVVIYYVVARKG